MKTKESDRKNAVLVVNRQFVPYGHYVRSSSKRAFTVVELLVVLATLAVLAGLMVPALARARVKSPAEVCLSNLRQLMVGWSMYKEENNDLLLPNAPAGVGPAGWVNSSLTEAWSPNVGNTNPIAVQSGLIGPYVNDIRVFKCPADVVPSANGQRLRSYSMNGQMGIVSTPNFNSGYLLFSKGSDITCPAPSGAFIFCDEHPGSINDGYLQVNLLTSQFPDVPAAYMAGGCGVSFADGHGEIHKWQTSVLLIGVTAGQTVSSLTASVNNVDWAWLRLRSGCTHR